MQREVSKMQTEKVRLVPSIERDNEEYISVPDWWARNEPDTVAIMENPAHVFIWDGDRLQHLAEERGVPFKWVMAPKSLREIGIHEVQAFPLWLLHDFYPVNP